MLSHELFLFIVVFFSLVQLFFMLLGHYLVIWFVGVLDLVFV